VTDKERVTVIDRRGQSAADEPAKPLPPPEPPAAAPPGEPIRCHCNHCGADISHSVSAFQVVLPQPGPGGNVSFAPQTVFALPLLCPSCEAPQMYRNAKPGVMVPKRLM
jgi:hypothetical protein